MNQEEVKTLKSGAQNTSGGRALANAICILALLFVLGFLWQSIGEIL